MSNTPRRASPVARRIAAVDQVDITSISGSGPAGRVMKADVLSARTADPAASKHPWLASRPPAPGVQHASQTPALRLAALAEPFGLTVMEVDMSRITAASALLAATRPSLALGDLVFVAQAATTALARHLLLNATWSEEWLIVRRRVHLGLIGRDGERRVIRDAQDLNVIGLARAMARRPAPQNDEGTFTLIDLGARPAFAMPLLAAGQSATLGLLVSRERPVVISQGGLDRVVVRPIAQLSLAYDARVLGLGHADAFLNDVRRSLERGSVH
jgi:pyruvate dehydrogenase E2 component (dihydrolipoamide acetyltransferase)